MQKPQRPRGKYSQRTQRTDPLRPLWAVSLRPQRLMLFKYAENAKFRNHGGNKSYFQGDRLCFPGNTSCDLPRESYFLGNILCDLPHRYYFLGNILCSLPRKSYFLRNIPCGEGNSCCFHGNGLYFSRKNPLYTQLALI